MSAIERLLNLPAAHDTGRRYGIPSVCSAHPLVIEAALLEAADTGDVALIEATCNQVNQNGGYTGMTPQDFHDYVLGIAARVGFPPENILFGGDHLGPNPWRDLPAAQAMEKAIVMTGAYAAAGFTKIHLDASMSCADDPSPLPPAEIARRAAALAKAADAKADIPPLFIIGTEVPVPGGAAEELDTLVITTPESATETIALHQQAFAAAGLGAAFDRVIGLVVQPGVEFGHANVIPFAPALATDLSDWRDKTGGIVFEAHSTDYQATEALAALVQGGFPILKVGPGLTFALREALYALDQIAGLIAADYDAGTLPNVMEGIMLSSPQHWQGYYHGDAVAQHLNRHFSYSDRIRYYWANPQAEAAVARLFGSLSDTPIPETLVSQFLPRLYGDVVNWVVPPTARSLALASIRAALAPYSMACRESNA